MNNPHPKPVGATLVVVLPHNMSCRFVHELLWFANGSGMPDSYGLEQVFCRRGEATQPVRCIFGVKKVCLARRFTDFVSGQIPKNFRSFHVI